MNTPTNEQIESAYAAFIAQLKKDGWTACDHRYIASEKRAVAAAISVIETDLSFKLSRAAEDVFMERKRQVMVEGWTPEHDDSHHDGHHSGELALAAASYCMSASADINPLLTAKTRHNEYARAWWPQHWGPRKPKGARRDLVRAAALIIAEIERIDRKGNTHAA